MASKKVIPREPNIIEAEISKLQDELAKSKKHFGIIDDESLRIPTHLKQFFPKQEFFKDHMQKIVWEEED